jgi:DNA-binding MarR family transcriptional regulator
LRRIVRNMRLYSRHAESRHGLSLAQLFILNQLRGEGELSLKQLAEAALTDLSSVSVVARRLTTKGLVTRRAAPDDRRSVLLKLTPQGQRILAKAGLTPQDVLRGAVLGLQPTEREELDRLLRLVVQNAGLEGSPATPFFEEGR